MTHPARKLAASKTKMKYRSGVNFYIYFHLMLVIVLIVIICSYIKENPVGLSILIGLLILTLVFNKIDYLEINPSHIIVQHVYGFRLFRKTFQYNIADVINISNREEGRKFVSVGFLFNKKGAIIINILTGVYFYQSINRFGIQFNDKSWKAFNVNTPTPDVTRIIKLFIDNKQ